MRTDWKNIPKQTVLHEPGSPAVGDCWRCCVAAIICAPAAELPHFVQIARDTQTDEDRLTQTWLTGNGWTMIHCQPAGFYQPNRVNRDYEGLPYIATGPTERSRGMGKHHAVVMVGNKMVYDPHPSEAGLTAITDIYLIVPVGICT